MEGEHILRVSALVVTYNRIEYLKECVNSLLNQSFRLESIIIFDNHSTDETQNYCESLNDRRINYVRSPKNLGGAGGFKSGMKYFIENDSSDYLWLMDDDTIPNANALEKFIDCVMEMKGKNFGFMASNVRWIDNNPAKMNIPLPVKEWSRLVSDNGLVGIRRATFVSLFLPRKVIVDIGYPIEEFFIWGDDVEYTERISQKYPSFFVNKSIVIHKMLENNRADIVKDSVSRIRRYKFAYRNRIYYNRKISKLDFFKQIFRSIRDIFSVIIRSENKKTKRIFYILYGTFLGLFFNPQIEYPRKSERV